MYVQFNQSDLEMLREFKECLTLVGYDRVLALERFIIKYRNIINNANNLILFSDIFYINATRNYIVACCNYRYYNVFLIYFVKRFDGKYEVLLTLYPLFGWEKELTLDFNSTVSISKNLYANFVLASINPELVNTNVKSLEFSVGKTKVRVAINNGGIFAKSRNDIYLPNNTQVEITAGKWLTKLTLACKDSEVCWHFKVYSKASHGVRKKDKERLKERLKEES